MESFISLISKSFKPLSTVQYYYPLSSKGSLRTIQVVLFSVACLSPLSGATQSFDLPEGWNLVTFRLQPTQPSPSDVFAAIAPSIDSVWGFDGAAQRWKSYLPGGVDLGPAGIDTIRADQAYWVHARRPIVNWIVEGELPGAGGLPLPAGWNLVGMPINALDLPAVLKIGDLFRGQNVLNAVRLFKWRRSSLGVSDEANPLDPSEFPDSFWTELSAESAFNLDDGYWVYTASPVTWAPSVPQINPFPYHFASDEMTVRMWDLGTNGIVQIPVVVDGSFPGGSVRFTSRGTAQNIVDYTIAGLPENVQVGTVAHSQGSTAAQISVRILDFDKLKSSRSLALSLVFDEDELDDLYSLTSEHPLSIRVTLLWADEGLYEGVLSMGTHPDDLETTELPVSVGFEPFRFGLRSDGTVVFAPVKEGMFSNGITGTYAGDANLEPQVSVADGQRFLLNAQDVYPNPVSVSFSPSETHRYAISGEGEATEVSESMLEIRGTVSIEGVLGTPIESPAAFRGIWTE